MTATLRWRSSDPACADPLAIERLVSGQIDPARVSIAERRAVVRRLHEQRMNDQEIARRTGMSGRNVLRIRYHHHGLPAIRGAW